MCAACLLPPLPAGFWPATVLYPIEMYIVKYEIRRNTRRWMWMECINVFCAIVSALAVR
jgi:hypothetical protein